MHGFVVAKEGDESMSEKQFDACPKCGEQVNIEYGNVYAENGWAWHSVECNSCGCKYTLEYEFKVVDWEEA